MRFSGVFQEEILCIILTRMVTRMDNLNDSLKNHKDFYDLLEDIFKFVKEFNIPMIFGLQFKENKKIKLISGIFTQFSGYLILYPSTYLVFHQ